MKNETDKREVFDDCGKCFSCGDLSLINYREECKECFYYEPPEFPCDGQTRIIP